MAEDKKDNVPKTTPAETGLNIAATVPSLVPWLGGPVSSVLSGISLDRRFARVAEVIEGLAGQLKDYQSESSETYVKKDEFQELLEKTLRLVADERSQQKRGIYRDFLVHAIMSPGEPYDEQLTFLRTLEQLQGDHIRVIEALMQVPETNLGPFGSPRQTLTKRLPDMPAQRIADLIDQLNDMRVTRMTSLNTMMTAQGAADLRHSVTPFGLRFVHYLMAEAR